MRKVAIIGAGSIVFCKTLMLDMLATPGLEDTEFALMAPSTARTMQVKDFIDKVIAKNNFPARVWITTDRREALKDAKYIISTFQIGGTTAFGMDYNIPMRFGVDQCIGDSMGPGGIFRAARTIPVCMDMAKDIKKLCPDALLLNYVNPMAMVSWALGEAGIKYVGLCHGVQTTLDLIAGYVEVPKEEIDFVCAGINHMAWFLKLNRCGEDLYPILKSRFELPEYYVNEKVRGEVFRHYGYIMTESTGHLSEYVPWFRKNDMALKLYCDEPAFGGETGAYYNLCAYVDQKYRNNMILDNEPVTLPPRSVEYGSYIIEAIELRKTFKFNGNIRNNGMITNLPSDCCAEGPLFADSTGLHATVIGNLPPQCAALNMTNINVQRLGTLAAITGDPELLMQAVSLDPLTSAKLTLHECREMTTAMLDAQRQWLPQFEGKSLRPAPIISIPEDVKRVLVPVDPALAIMARFGELSK